MYVAVVLLTLMRWLSKRYDSDFNVGGYESDMPAMRANFKNGLRLVGKEIEALFLSRTFPRSALSRLERRTDCAFVVPNMVETMKCANNLTPEQPRRPSKAVKY